MTCSAYYNEFNPYCAQWLRNLINEKLIAHGDVDDRDINEVTPTDLKGYTQCHFFAGIGGWSLALRLAGWSDDRPVWTGSCPCQPFSLVGKRTGTSDPRHLWPRWFDLISKCKPECVMGEQVHHAIGKGWLDTVCSDMDTENYTTGALVSSSAPITDNHDGTRLWFISSLSCDSERKQGPRTGQESGIIRQGWPRSTSDLQSVVRSPMQPGEYHPQPIICLDHDGLSPGVVKARTHAAGNAIAPYVAANIIRSYMDDIQSR